MKRYAFLGLALLACVSVHAQTVASCPTATAGAAWAANAWLPCTPAATYIAQPVPATAIINDMRCPATGACALSWQNSSAVLPTDQVWVQTTAAPTGTWVLASTLKLGAPITPIPPSAYDAQAVVSWTAPASFTDGTSITMPLTYNLYRGTSATALTKLTNVSALTYTDPAGSATPTTYYYAVTATCSTCAESAQSGVVSKTIAAPKLTPGAPAATIK
jgi:hypothetical protein